jgi:hypothetical protein
MTLLLKVEEVLEIQGRGSVILPGIFDSELNKVTVSRGDPIELRKPDGSRIVTHAEAFEFLDRSNRRSSLVIVLPAEFKKKDIPIGTEIWLRDR